MDLFAPTIGQDGVSLPALAPKFDIKKHRSLCKRLGVTCYADLKPKTAPIILRVDLNVKHDAKHFREHPRVRQTVNTILWFLSRGDKLVIMSHGSKEGQGENRKQASNIKIIKRLKREFPELRERINFVPARSLDREQSEVNDAQYLRIVNKKLSKLEFGSALFLENIRMLKADKRNPLDLAGAIQNKFHSAVHDGFGVAHREGQFSTDGLFRSFRMERKALGPSSCEEWEHILRLVSGRDDKSLAVVIGGDQDKFETKLKLLEEILESGRVKLVYLGGVFGTAFLLANGSKLGKTPVLNDENLMAQLSGLVKKFKDVEFMLPDKFVGLDGKSLSEWQIEGTGIKRKIILPENAMALDQTVTDFGDILCKREISQVLAVGPLGYYVKPPFNQGTLGTYLSLYNWAKAEQGRQLIVGGGDSLSALLEQEEFRNPHESTFISSGGGSLLSAIGEVLRAHKSGEFISNPALEALRA